MTTKGSYALHQQILQLAMLDAQKAFPEARMFTRHVGLFLTLRGTKIEIGVKGQADLWLLLPLYINGVKVLIHVEIEGKSGNASLSPKQKEWRELITSMGGLYIVVRKPEDIRTSILERYGQFLLN